MTRPDVKPVSSLMHTLYQRYQFLQRRRLLRWKYPLQRDLPPSRELLDDLLWPVQVPELDLRPLLGDVEEIARRHQLDVLDLLAVVLANSTPAQRDSGNRPVDDIELLTLRLDRLRQVISGVERHVDALEHTIQATGARSEGYWKAQQWSSSELVTWLRLSSRTWRSVHRFKQPLTRGIKALDEAERSSTVKDARAGQVWLQRLFPDVLLNSWEYVPLLVHLGLWALHSAHALGDPAAIRIAAARHLRYLKQLETPEDVDQIDHLRTGEVQP
jgi:hypothetical protein